HTEGLHCANTSLDLSFHKFRARRLFRKIDVTKRMRPNFVSHFGCLDHSDQIGCIPAWSRLQVAARVMEVPVPAPSVVRRRPRHLRMRGAVSAAVTPFEKHMANGRPCNWNSRSLKQVE